MDELLRYLPDWVNKWGPLLLILLAVLYGLYLLILRVIKSIQEIMTGIGKDVVMALDKPTEALSKQANSMDRLTISINDYVGRDADEHKEIIILQRVITDELGKIRKQSSRIEDSIEEIKHGRGQDREIS